MAAAERGIFRFSLSYGWRRWLNQSMSADKARLYHDFGTLLRSGFHLDRAVDMLLGQNPSSERRSWLLGLRQGLAEKLTVSGSLAKHGAGHVSDLELGLIEAGERGGRLEESCDHLAEYFELRQKSISKAIGALIYPLILAHLGALVPDLSRALGGEGLAGAFGGAPWRILGLWIILGVLFLIAITWLKIARTSESADRLMGAIPLVDATRRHWALARFAQVMRTGLMASLRISEVLELAGAASQSAVLRASASRASVQVRQGNTLTASMRIAGGFPSQFVNAVEMAEHAGTLDIEMSRWMKAEMEMAARTQDRLAEWMPRLIYVVVVLWIAYRIITAFTGYFGKLGNMAEGIDL
jgi:type II secretory pathway component PulF